MKAKRVLSHLTEVLAAWRNPPLPINYINYNMSLERYLGNLSFPFLEWQNSLSPQLGGFEWTLPKPCHRLYSF